MSDANLREAIVKNFLRFNRLESKARLTPAAVGIVLLQDHETFVIPIFQRPYSMRQHAGQMALPGGRLQGGESAEGCAIRETHEELGLQVDGNAVLGVLDDFNTKSGFKITPIVLWGGATVSALSPSSLEVGRLFAVTLDELRGAVAASAPDHAFSLRFSSVEVFAPTAAILYQFSEVALDGRITRVAHFYQPPFTHR